ncbi:MAG: hypothetical protein JOY54_12335 [Acidobacteriaceae bacterium]|nr:hypothetical protein [Acidobacteriaceae bacterium]
MRKCLLLPFRAVVLCLIGALSSFAPAALASDAAPLDYSALPNTMVERAGAELARIKLLVDQGTLPKSRLAEAQEKLADAQDDAILAGTLYGETMIQDMTPEQASAMVAAAQRRVDRQAKLVEDRRQLLDTGILSRSEFDRYQEELDSRKRVLGLAQNRMQLLEELRQMAATEQRLEQLSKLSQPALKDVMLRYDGNGLFQLSQLPKIEAAFERQFHRALPVSALGETQLHQSMGLDHHNRVDVALNPDAPEGIWLRQFLEQLRIPYLAFRAAFAGAATAPHIHIGTGSTRLRLAQR